MRRGQRGPAIGDAYWSGTSCRRRHLLPNWRAKCAANGLRYVLFSIVYLFMRVVIVATFFLVNYKLTIVGFRFYHVLLANHTTCLLTYPFFFPFVKVMHRRLLSGRGGWLERNGPGPRRLLPMSRRSQRMASASLRRYIAHCDIVTLCGIMHIVYYHGTY